MAGYVPMAAICGLLGKTGDKLLKAKVVGAIMAAIKNEQEPK